MAFFSCRRRLGVILSLLLSLLLFAGRAAAQIPTWQSALTLGIFEGSAVRTAVNATGNVFVTGFFYGIVTIGDTTLYTTGGADIFVAKFTSTGARDWVATAGGPGTDSGQGMALDSHGDVILTGAIGGPTATFGTLVLSAPGASTTGDLFIAKLSAAGVWQWVQSAGGSEGEGGAALALDAADNVYVTGSFASPTLTLGPTTLTRVGGTQSSDVFVAMLSPTGAWQWATSAGGTRQDNATGLVLDPSGNLWISGSYYSPSITFGPTTLPGSTGTSRESFVAKLSPIGAWLEAAAITGQYEEIISDLGVDGQGNVLVTGTFTSPAVTFGGTLLPKMNATFYFETFVAKLTPGSGWQWAIGAGGSGFSNLLSIGLTVDASGRATITGKFENPVAIFGPFSLTNTGTADVFVAQVTPTGAWGWAVSAGGTALDQGIGITPAGSAFTVTGVVLGPAANFGNVAYASPATSAQGSLFLARLANPNGLGAAASPTAFTLAPNPARHTVRLTGATARTATVVDGLGRPVRTQLLPATGELDLTGLVPGLYTVRAGQQARRLVVE